MAEIAIPLIALGGLYVIFKDRKNSGNSGMLEGFDPVMHNSKYLRPSDIPDKNYPSSLPILNQETDLTSKLSTANKYTSGNGAYTDKYFNPNMNARMIASASQTEKDAMNKYEKAQKYYSMDGKQVDPSYFSNHSNPVPFFGSSVKTRSPNANSTESIMDNMTGAGSQMIVKKEQSPLFSPDENYHFPNGAPNMTDFYQSRVNPSMRMANVKPFEEIKVGPGIGLGYTAEGQGGYNSGMMARDLWTEKNVDELRAKNKPKAGGLSSLGFEGPANSYIKNMGDTTHMGNFEKYRPEKAFEMNSDRYMTTTGAASAPTLRPIEIDRHVNRPDTSVDYTGAAGYSNPSAYVSGEFMPSKHVDLGPVPIAVANANGRAGANEIDYGMKSNTAYLNNRAANVQDDYFGIVGSGLGAMLAPIMDIIRPSRRENTIGTLRPYQNAKNSVGSTYVFNPADRPAATIRETTENSKFHLNVNANQNGGAYQTTQHQPVNNQRDSTTDFYYAGGSSAGAGAREVASYEAGYNQRNNDIKSSTIDGRLVKGNMALFNADTNMKSKPKDALMRNDRSYAPTMPSQSPNLDTFGQLQGKNTLYQNIQTDRSNADILSSLKSNPYAHSVMGGI